MRGLALETPLLADFERCPDTRAVRWSVLPNAVIDAVPTWVKNDLARALYASRRDTGADLFVGDVEDEHRCGLFQIAGNLVLDFIYPTIAGQDCGEVGHLS